MDKKRISVNIEGRSYAVITTDNEEYVKSIAREVSDAILKASRSAMQLDVRDCAILAAMDFCDDSKKATTRNKDLVAKADQIIKQTNSLNKQVSEYKDQVKSYRDRLTDAMNESTRLSKRVHALEEQLRVLSKENDALRKAAEQKKPDSEKKFEKAVHEKKNEKIMGYVPMRQGSLFDDLPSPNQRKGKK